jgi:hypothetical protein
MSGPVPGRGPAVEEHWPTMQNEFSVTEKCLIEIFDINFCLN